jgi:aspartate racemase
MEQDFYRGRLETHHGLKIVVPDQNDRSLVHDIIYNELVLGLIHDASRLAYRRVIAKLVEDGAQGIILGCTEIDLLLSDMTFRYRPLTQPAYTPNGQLSSPFSRHQ